jgi:predicted transcriptional regulator
MFDFLKVLSEYQARKTHIILHARLSPALFDKYEGILLKQKLIEKPKDVPYYKMTEKGKEWFRYAKEVVPLPNGE